MFFLLALLACATEDAPAVLDDTAEQGPPDGDGDGTPDAADCAPEDGGIFPGAEEACNEIDDNCDGAVDEGLTSTFYADYDGDGYGVEEEPVEACAAPEGYAEVAGDCDNTSSATYPEAFEACDTVDNDCDEEIDEDGPTLWYTDADDDGWGYGPSEDYGVEGCSLGGASRYGDCNDVDAGISPDVEEIPYDTIDQDCDNEDECDVDGDGYGSELCECTDCTDCDDGDPEVTDGC